MSPGSWCRRGSGWCHRRTPGRSTSGRRGSSHHRGDRRRGRRLRGFVTEALDLVTATARAASEKQAHDIVVLDVGKVFVLSDYFLIASGSTDRQVRTIAEEIEKAARALGARPVR